MTKFQEALAQLGKGSSIQCDGLKVVELKGAFVLARYSGKEDSWVHVYTLRSALEAAMSQGRQSILEAEAEPVVQSRRHSRHNKPEDVSE